MPWPSSCLKCGHGKHSKLSVGRRWHRGPGRAGPAQPAKKISIGRATTFAAARYLLHPQWLNTHTRHRSPESLEQACAAGHGKWHWGQALERMATYPALRRKLRRGPLASASLSHRICRRGVIGYCLAVNAPTSPLVWSALSLKTCRNWRGSFHHQ